jgi:hypothetical protein
LHPAAQTPRLGRITLSTRCASSRAMSRTSPTSIPAGKHEYTVKLFFNHSLQASTNFAACAPPPSRAKDDLDP